MAIAITNLRISSRFDFSEIPKSYRQTEQVGKLHGKYMITYFDSVGDTIKHQNVQDVIYTALCHIWVKSGSGSSS